MELLPFVFALIGLYLLYWVRMGVCDAIADADERRKDGGPEALGGRSIGS